MSILVIDKFRMDKDDVRLNISPSFSRSSNNFKKIAFVDNDSFKCLHLPEDLEYI